MEGFDFRKREIIEGEKLSKLMVKDELLAGLDWCFSSIQRLPPFPPMAKKKCREIVRTIKSEVAEQENIQTIKALATNLPRSEIKGLCYYLKDTF